VQVVAYVPDLMDRSKLSFANARFVRSAAELTAAEADVAVADLARDGSFEALEASGIARRIGFAPHVEDDLIHRAKAGGIEAMPRSRFFRQVRSLLEDPCGADEIL
jgi:hypothetical protein